MAAQTQQGPWLHNRFIDLMTGCGGWSLPLIVGATALGASHRVELGAAFYFLAVFCNNPHYMATIYRAYGGKKEFKRYRVYSLYLTSLILVAGVIAHSFPGFVPWLVTIYLVWSPWHYTGQNFGISMLMSRRAGASPSKAARNLIYVSYIASYLVWLVELIEMSPAGAISVTWEIPLGLSVTLRTCGILVFLTSSVMGFYLLAQSVRQYRQLISAALLHASQFLWFLLPSIASLFSTSPVNNTYFSAGVLAFMHCAQYLWITSYFAKKEAVETNSTDAKKWSSWRYFGLLTIGGIALFTPGPWLVSTLFGQDLFQSALVFTALVNIHHFMLDGAIWKLRDNRISRLLFGSRQTGHHQAEEEEIDERPEILLWIFSPQKSARTLRWSLAATLVLVAGLDQTQNLLTLKGSSIDQVAIARQINPNDSRVSLRLAQHKAFEGEVDEAISILETERTRSPRNLAILHLLAQLRFKSDDLQNAAEVYGEILEITPDDESALTNGALIALDNKEWEKASTLLSRLHQVAPAKAPTSRLLGIAFQSSQNFRYAIPAYEQYLQLARLDPENNPVSEVIEVSNQLAKCYDEIGSHETARQLRIAAQSLFAQH